MSARDTLTETAIAGSPLSSQDRSAAQVRLPHELVKLGDETVFLKQGDKLSRRLEAPLRVVPPDQRLRARQLVVLNPVLGLQIDHELAFLQRSLHAVRDGLLPQQLVAQLVVVGGEILSVLALDAAAAKSARSHICSKGMVRSTTANTPHFMDTLLVFDMALISISAFRNISLEYSQLCSSRHTNWSALNRPQRPRPFTIRV